MKKYSEYTLNHLNKHSLIKIIKELYERYDKALSIMADYSPPCEFDGFMDKNTDYCSINCGVDEEVFKECWNRYIEQSLQGNKEEE